MLAALQHQQQQVSGQTSILGSGLSEQFGAKLPSSRKPVELSFDYVKLP